MDSLAQVADEVRGCLRCRLRETRTAAVPGEGPAGAGLMVVGEAPGATEDRVGRPFQGASGRHLTAALAEAGLPREEVFVTSVCKCRPPGNRDPRPDEVAACAGYLDRQLALVAPRVVLAMGLVAASRLGLAGRGQRLADVRGAPHGPTPEQPFVVLATYHPAAAMRFPRLRRPFADDLAAAVALARDP
jgi:uracil-DNA glycosylase